MGRPRKYESDAARQAAFRKRWAGLTVNIEEKTADTVARLAKHHDTSQSEIVSQALKFAFTNHPAFQFSELPLPYRYLAKQNPIED